MRIAITGASGFVGAAATAHLQAAGHSIVRLVRGAAQATDEAAWQPASEELDAQAVGPIDAVLHLAGENVAAGRWSAARKRAIADSRGPVTRALCRGLLALPKPPAVLICASATGIYSDRGDTLLDEQSATGSGFLADVARAWEAGTSEASAAGLRVVNLRLGMVLDPSGGALRRMLPAFRFGVGGRLGSGRQWLSWITLADLVRVIEWTLSHENLTGPVLAVTPHPVTNLEFTKSLGRVLRRPTVLPVPAFALRLLFGEMAEALLLASQRAMPTQLLATGFRFERPYLEPALRAQLAKGSAPG